MTKDQLANGILNLQSRSRIAMSSADFTLYVPPPDDTIVSTSGSDVELWTDGSSIGNPGPGGAAFVDIRDGEIIKEYSQHLGRCTNNFAEYSAVISALEHCRMTTNEGDTSPQNITVYSDSLLAVNQINGTWKVKNSTLSTLHTRVAELKADLNILGKRTAFKHVRAHCGNKYNELADKLANTAARQTVQPV